MLQAFMRSKERKTRKRGKSWKSLGAAQMPSDVMVTSFNESLHFQKKERKPEPKQKKRSHDFWSTIGCTSCSWSLNPRDNIERDTKGSEPILDRERHSLLYDHTDSAQSMILGFHSRRRTTLPLGHLSPQGCPSPS